MKLHVKSAYLSVLAATILAACGGGGGGANSGTVASAALAGVVVDGLIEGASVCLDLNVNLVCDAGEPSAITAQNGSYSLSLAGLSTAQIRGAHIITSVPLTAKDADDGGKTLAQAGKAAFNLMSPAEAFVSADGATISTVVVSPLTTMISHEMMSGPGKTASAAEASVVTTLGLTTGTNLRSNFVGQTDAASVGMQKQARFLAATLGEVKKSIGTGAASSTDRERQLGALNYLKTNAAALVVAINSSNASTAAAQLQAAKAALANATVMPAPAANTLVTGAQAFASASTTMDAVASDWTATIGGGFYSGDCSRRSWSSSGPTPFVTIYTCNEWSHGKVSSNGAGKWMWEPFVLTNSAWLAQSISTGTFTSDGMGGMIVNRDGDENDTQQVRLSIKDISGKAVSDLIGVDTVDMDSNTLGRVSQYLSPSVSTSFKNTVFPLGSKRVAFNSIYDREKYYVGSTAVIKYSPPTNFYSGFEDFIADFPSSVDCKKQSRSLFNYPSTDSFGLTFTFDSGGTDSKGLITICKHEKAAANTETVVSEKGSYEVRTVQGKQYLHICPPTTGLAARKAPSDEQVYTVVNGQLYQGSYWSAAYRSAQASSPYWNAVAMNAILAGAGLPAVAK